MSRLEEVNAPLRNKELAKNPYSSNVPYSAGHPDALSTGDEQGKGENNGSIGSSTDIKTRETLLAKNKFTPNKEYNDSTA